MNVKELKAAFDKLGAEHEGKEVKVWLPGSRIYLTGVFLNGSTVLIEGNVEPGSALDGLAR